MEKPLPPQTILAVSALAGCLVLVLIVYLVWRGRRKSGLVGVANRLGMQGIRFDMTPGEAIPVMTCGKQLVKVGDRFVGGTIDGVEVWIIDAELVDINIACQGDGRLETEHLHYEKGSDWCTTVVTLKSPDMGLPAFELSPRSKVEDVVAANRGITDFSNEEFVGANKVDGEEEHRITHTLTEPVQRLMRRNRTLSIRATGDTLALYRMKDMMSLSEIEMAAELGLELVAIFAATPEQML